MGRVPEVGDHTCSPISHLAAYEKLVSGVWDIPIPEKREIVIPVMVRAPLVGFDRASYRLCYGGGYFDRTLAALGPRPFAIDVGFAFQQLETLYPQPFDMPMDLIVTEARLQRRASQRD